VGAADLHPPSWTTFSPDLWSETMLAGRSRLSFLFVGIVIKKDHAARPVRA
jgi:hypothetical protein